MLSINEITSIWHDSDTPLQKKVKWEQEKFCFCLILQIFFF